MKDQNLKKYEWLVKNSGVLNIERITSNTKISKTCALKKNITISKYFPL